MHVRLLTATDAKAYQQLRLLALRETPTAFSASYEDEVDRSIDEIAVRISSAADGSVCTFGVFDHDRLAGFVAVIHPQRAKLRHSVEFAGMYVAPEYRRHGFARMLLRAAIIHIQSLAGVRHIKLGVNAANVAAKTLYQSVGFESFGVEPDALCVNGHFYDEEHYVLRISSLELQGISIGNTI